MRTQAEREYDLLIAALAEMPPPPCGTGRNKCSEWAKCSTGQMACARYKHWVDFGLNDEHFAKIPSTGIFNRIFSDLEDGQVELRLEEV